MYHEVPGFPSGSITHHTSTIMPVCPEQETKAKRDYDDPRSQLCVRPQLQIQVRDPKALHFPFFIQGIATSGRVGIGLND